MSDAKNENHPGTTNRNNQSDLEFQKDQANGNIGDPSSRRNIGLNGETQRNNQKDELENMQIGGSEVTGYGNLTPDDNESIAAGPGFEAEGSEFSNDHLAGEIENPVPEMTSRTPEENSPVLEKTSLDSEGNRIAPIEKQPIVEKGSPAPEKSNLAPEEISPASEEEEKPHIE
jgi:hypothetical protein